MPQLYAYVANESTLKQSINSFTNLFANSRLFQVLKNDKVRSCSF